MPTSPPRLPAQDIVLATRLRNGDHDAYATVFTTYYLPIVRFLGRYLDSREAAEDVTQDVFLRLWEMHESVDPTRSLKAYLFAAARNSALNLVARRDMARRHMEEVIQELGESADVPSDPSADELVTVAELLQMAEARVATLSPRLREVYHLSRHEGLTVVEIAEVLGTSVHTVYAQMAKVTQALHPVLKAWIEE